MTTITEQIQRTTYAETNGYITETANRVTVDSIDEVADIGEPSFNIRPRGQSKRKWAKSSGGVGGADFYFFNCTCGKSTGNMYCKKQYNMWLRLHKKKCLKN
tara:strand:+ start:40 stop:345 length:306 start_codon:yes stop_codon:yes gene_type:complete